jgi:hypothetical protein
MADELLKAEDEEIAALLQAQIEATKHKLEVAARAEKTKVSYMLRRLCVTQK